MATESCVCARACARACVRVCVCVCVGKNDISYKCSTEIKNDLRDSEHNRRLTSTVSPSSTSFGACACLRAHGTTRDANEIFRVSLPSSKICNLVALLMSMMKVFKMLSVALGYSVCIIRRTIRHCGERFVEK
jgi:hypothetical protein